MPKTQEWLTRQYSKIGGSTAAIPAGQAPPYAMTPRQLYDLMDGAIRKKRVPEKDETADMRRGTLLEPIARNALAAQLGHEIYPAPQEDFLDNPDYPWAHALTDGWVGKLPVELKVPRPSTYSRVALQGLPPHWMLQGQHVLAIVGAPVIHFGLLDPVSMDIMHIPVERDEKVIAELMAAEEQFYNCVLAETPPPEDEAAHAVELPPTDGKLKVLDSDEARAAALHYQRVRELGDETALVLMEAKARLSALAEGAEVCEVPGLLRFYQRPQPGRRTFDYKRMLAENPAMDPTRYWSTTKPSTPFRAYVLNDTKGE